MRPTYLFDKLTQVSAQENGLANTLYEEWLMRWEKTLRLVSVLELKLDDERIEKDIKYVLYFGFYKI